MQCHSQYKKVNIELMLERKTALDARKVKLFSKETNFKGAILQGGGLVSPRSLQIIE